MHIGIRYVLPHKNAVCRPIHMVALVPCIEFYRLARSPRLPEPVCEAGTHGSCPALRLLDSANASRLLHYTSQLLIRTFFCSVKLIVLSNAYENNGCTM